MIEVAVSAFLLAVAAVLAAVAGFISWALWKTKGERG